MRLAAILSLALALATSAPAAVPGDDQPTPYLIDNNAIARITCGAWLGTGSYLGNGLIVTVMHVAKFGNCKADGAPAQLVQTAPGLDYALLRTSAHDAYRMLLDCSGFHEGQRVLATGYAEAAPRTVTQILTASISQTRERSFMGETILRGSATQGMSGGPVVDLNTGALVGLINANTADGITQVLSLPISATPLCKKAAS